MAEFEAKVLDKSRPFSPLELDLAREAAERLETWLSDSVWRFKVAKAERGVIFQLLLDRGAGMAVQLGLSKREYLKACGFLFDVHHYQQEEAKHADPD